LQREGFIKFSSMAVFYRTNAQSRVLEEALRLARVPYTLVSGRSFYDRAEVRDAAAYLRLMANPRSDADLQRIINTPARGIGDTTVERLTEGRFNIASSSEGGEPEFMLVNDSHDGSCWLWDYEHGRRFLESGEAVTYGQGDEDLPDDDQDRGPKLLGP
jgi:hypothetical protein